MGQKEIIKTCEYCGLKYKTTYSRRDGSKQPSKYCSRECFFNSIKGKHPESLSNYYNTHDVWNKSLTKETDDRLKAISEKSRQQMIHEYATGIRDRFEITKKANEAVREHGLPKLKGKPTWIKGKTKNNSIQLKRLSEARKGKGNPMYGKRGWNYIDGKSKSKEWRRKSDWREIRKKALTRDKHRCCSCGMTQKEHYAKYGMGLGVDHIIPYRIVLEHKLDNLQTLCSRCHNTKTPEDMKKWHLPKRPQ